MSKALNELKKATMASYLSKAGGRVRSGTKIGLDFENDAYRDLKTVNRHSEYNVDGKEKDPVIRAKAEKSMAVNTDLAKTFKRDAANRIKGIARAGRLLAKEDAEQIDELKKSTLGSYLKKAVNRHGVTSANIGALAGAAAVVAPGETLSKDELDDHLGKKAMRQSVTGAKGMSRAITKLAKEETVNEAGKNPYGPGYKLVDKDGKELSVGHKFKAIPLHHEKPEHHEITGWQSGEQRGNSSSSGRVAVRIGKGKKAYDTEYFPHVFGMKVVKEEAVNEVSTGKMAAVATARFKQAQAALKDKDYGGYVKNKAKSMKAADAITPKSGWSPEDDKKNEEVNGGTGFVSPQEKYRQIKEARMAKAQKSTTTHHNFYVYHDDLANASKLLKAKNIPHSVADHSSAPVDHSVISVRHGKHVDAAYDVLNKNGIDFGGR